MKFAALLTLIYAGVAIAVCPNRCSSHGTCGSADLCDCHPQWTGPDCSQRECPYGLSWVLNADNTDQVTPSASGNGSRNYAECSNKGSCDRSSGICQCFEGYEGRACKRQSCPNECSGHGRCVSNAQVSSSYSASSGAKFNSQFWDADGTRVCSCNRGWEGYDCSSRVCPKGDDPVTDCSTGNGAAHHMVQRLYVETVRNETPACHTEAVSARSLLLTDNGSAGNVIRGSDPNTFYAKRMDGHANGLHCLGVGVCSDVDTSTTIPGKTEGDCLLDNGTFSDPDCDITNILGQTECEKRGFTWDTNATAKCVNTAGTTQALCEDNNNQYSTKQFYGNYYGYISLMYTDMYDGQYYTRPILMDSSKFATYSTTQVTPEGQYETTSSVLYNSDASLPSGDTTVPAAQTHLKHGYDGSSLHSAADSVSGHQSITENTMVGTKLKRYTADRIRHALESLPNFAIPQVNVTNYYDGANGPWGNVFDITFTDEATSGQQNLLQCVYDSGRACTGAQPRMANVDPYGDYVHNLGSSSKSRTAIPAQGYCSDSSITNKKECMENACVHNSGTNIGEVAVELTSSSDCTTLDGENSNDLIWGPYSYGCVDSNDDFLYRGACDTQLNPPDSTHFANTLHRRYWTDGKGVPVAGETTFINFCAVYEVPLSSGKSYEENAECSNRGMCNAGDGTCECFEGHTGENCATQTVFF